MSIFRHPLYAGKKLTIVTVANAGRRPVTIRSVGAIRDYPQTCLSLMDTMPKLPHELTEGKDLQAICPDDGSTDLSTVLWWSASDALGREYFSNGTWWQRWSWERRSIAGLKKEARDKKKSHP